MDTQGGERMRSNERAPRLLIVVENESIPQDRRVWQQTRTLIRAGWDVTTLSPAIAPHDRRHEVLDGVTVWREPIPDGHSAAGWIGEYAVALHRFGRRIRRELAAGAHFDVVQVCNPPDLFVLPVLQLKRRGARVVFDQHDLCPELWLAKGGRATGPVHRALLASERLTYRVADAVASPNDSYRRTALVRGRMDLDDVVVVRNGPDLRRMTPTAPRDDLAGPPHALVGYVGVIGEQDGVDHLVRAVHQLVEAERRDVRAVVLGDGPALASVQALAAELGVDDRILFTGRVPATEVANYLAPTDVCVVPDPANPFNHASSMTKILEYFALRKPTVGYRLRESEVTAEGAMAFVDHHAGSDGTELGKAIGDLLDDPERAERLARAGAARLHHDRFTWAGSEAAYLGLMRAQLSPELAERVAAEPAVVDVDADAVAAPEVPSR